MDPSFSSEDKFNIKTRKPYTITKQRERWTEDEHNSFLEALKLYGRAWQRIEEHIGTKTAVQIRSHAQKFFTKLEKEALAKGVSTRQALDLEIPPPRPKRKPNYPYPRKTGSKTHPKDGNQPSLASSLQLDLERKPLPETSSHEEKQENAKMNEQVENEEEAPCASSENERSVAGVFREFIPSVEDVNNHDQDSDTIKHTSTTSNTLFDFPEGQTSDTRGMHNYPRHVPVQVVDGNQGITPKSSVPVPVQDLPQESALDKSEVFNLAAGSGTTGHDNNGSRSSNYQTIPTFHPLFTPFCDNQENYRSFLHVSSTISNLIVSSLLQNPAAHAAANYAATFWHHPPETAASTGDSSSREHETPSMAAIAAATVAAATAWWAAHGMLPVCTPFYPGYSSCTSPIPFGPPVNGNQTKVEENGREEDVKKIVESSSDDSDGKLDTEPNVNDGNGTKDATLPVVELTNVGKQVDRSSCGSNTTSSSDIETDALEKHGKEKEEIKVADVNDSVSRGRVRTTFTPNESWKEVSEEGRLAFQALFSREVLPQSFSSRQTSEFDLNQMSCPSLRNEKNVEGLLTIGLGNVKLNVHHTGFKPYKRCSIEAKENTQTMNTSTGACQNDEKDPKRMRLEAEAST